MPELAQIIDIALRAGELILPYYRQSEIHADTKADGSPVTEADVKADGLIREGLLKADPGTPIISEESAVPEYEVRKNWRRFWLVDPLDGTKGFLRRTDDFTVNIALIAGGEPVLGVIYAPVPGWTCYAQKGKGSWKRESGGEPVRLISRMPDTSAPLIVAQSRSHSSPELEDFLKDYRIKERVKIGSSIKFCMVAEGKADFYPRLGPTMEWDVAAGDCLYRDSAEQGRHPTSLRYNKPSLRNGGFVIGLPPAAARQAG